MGEHCRGTLELIAVDEAEALREMIERASFEATQYEYYRKLKKDKAWQEFEESESHRYEIMLEDYHRKYLAWEAELDAAISRFDGSEAEYFAALRQYEIELANYTILKQHYDEDMILYNRALKEYEQQQRARKATINAKKDNGVSSSEECIIQPPVALTPPAAIGEPPTFDQPGAPPEEPEFIRGNFELLYKNN